MVGPTPLRVWCVPGKLHLARFALDIGAFALDFFERYYGLPYPGDKLDMLAIPDFAAGAMENLGAITYRETALLVDEAAASHAERERVADVVAHEIAHMWFGDLVTMLWWNGIWLNEAFATFMELLAVDAWKPEWKRWTTFGVSRAAAMGVDGLHNTRPIEFEVRAPRDCEAMFDLLTYEKGASVLRMLEQHLSAGRVPRRGPALPRAPPLRQRGDHRSLEGPGRRLAAADPGGDGRLDLPARLPARDRRARRHRHQALPAPLHVPPGRGPRPRALEDPGAGARLGQARLRGQAGAPGRRGPRGRAPRRAGLGGRQRGRARLLPGAVRGAAPAEDDELAQEARAHRALQPGERRLRPGPGRPHAVARLPRSHRALRRGDRSQRVDRADRLVGLRQPGHRRRGAARPRGAGAPAGGGGGGAARLGGPAGRGRARAAAARRSPAHPRHPGQRPGRPRSAPARSTPATARTSRRSIPTCCPR